MQHWTHFLTESAILALRCIHLRIPESFVIRLKRDCSMRANISARIASTTIYFIRDVYHILIFPFGFGVVHPSFMHRLPSPAIGIMICSDLCIFLFASLLATYERHTGQIRENKYSPIHLYTSYSLSSIFFVMFSHYCPLKI